MTAFVAGAVFIPRAQYGSDGFITAVAEDGEAVGPLAVGPGHIVGHCLAPDVEPFDVALPVAFSHLLHATDTHHGRADEPRTSGDVDSYEEGEDVVGVHDSCF